MIFFLFDCFVLFSKDQENKLVLPLSGNPGYVFQKNILAGVATSRNEPAIDGSNTIVTKKAIARTKVIFFFVFFILSNEIRIDCRANPLFLFLFLLGVGSVLIIIALLL